MIPSTGALVARSADCHRPLFATSAAICIALTAVAARANDNGPPFPTKRENGFVLLHGGVGVTERDAMEQVRPRYNLQLGFALRGSGAYLAVVTVVIQDAARPERKLLEAVSDGPWFFAKLPAGSYRTTVTHGRTAQSAMVRVTAAVPAQVMYFYWQE